jgi:hypothetical protein
LLLSWCCCPHCNGVAIVNVQASSLQSKSLCCHCNNTVAHVAMASLPSSSWCRCPWPLSIRRRLYCCHNGIIALIALVLLPTLHGHCCPCYTSIAVLIELTSLPSHCMGAVTGVALALLPLLSWHVCAVALVSLPLSCWPCCPCCTGISAFVPQASLPLLYLCCAVDLQVSLPLLSWHVLSRGHHGRPCRRQQQHRCNMGNNASTIRVATPAQSGQ